MAEASATKTNEESEQADGVEVSQAELPAAADNGNRSGGGQIGVLLDTTVAISAELGQMEVQVRDLLQMGPGSVLQLDRLVGEPVDLYLRGAKFATASLVVVGDQLGVRIKDILPSPSQTQSDSDQEPAG